MYTKEMISVGKVANGYIVECRVSFKKEAKKSDKMTSCCCGPSEYGGSCEKQYLAKTADEVAELVEDIMPLLSQDFKDESEFDAAFAEATKEMEKSNGAKKEED